MSSKKLMIAVLATLLLALPFGGADASEPPAPSSVTAPAVDAPTDHVSTPPAAVAFAASASATALQTVDPRELITIPPTRLLETRGESFRTADGLFQGQGVLAAGQTLELQVTGRMGIPATGVDAVVINVSAVTPTGGFGWITAFPCGAIPHASSLTYEADDVSVSNEVIAKLSATGTVCLYSLQSTHLVVDATGYVPATSGYVPLEGMRLLETRSGDGFATTDGQFLGAGALAAGATLELQVAGRGGIPATDVKAVAINISVVTPTGGFGWITTFPCGTKPNASSLTYETGDISVSNEIIAKLSADGTVCLFSSQAAHLVADATGYFLSSSPYETMEPSRLLETRSGSPSFTTIDGQFAGDGSVAAGTKVELQITGRAGIPDDNVEAVVLNVSAVTPTGGFGWITVYPCGTRPNVAALTYNTGDISVSNEVIAKVSPRGEVCLFSSQTVDLVADATGYFPAANDFTGPMYDVVRTQSVSQIVAALEAHAADYRTFRVDGAGQWELGEGSFSIGGIDLYPVSIRDRLTDLGYLQPGEIPPDPTYNGTVGTDYAVAVCKDRAVVYSLAYAVEPLAADLEWWETNECVRGDRDTLDKTYFQLSRPLGELLPAQVIPTVSVQGFTRDLDGRLVATIVVDPNGAAVAGVKVLATATGGHQLYRCVAIGCSTDMSTGHISALTLEDGGWTTPTEIGTFTFDYFDGDTAPLDLTLVEAIDDLGVDIELGGDVAGASLQQSDQFAEPAVVPGLVTPTGGSGDVSAASTGDEVFGYPIAEGYVIAPRSHKWIVTGVNGRIFLAFISSSFSLDAFGNELRRNGPYVHFGTEHGSGTLHPDAAWSCTETTGYLIFILFFPISVDTSACVRVIPCGHFGDMELVRGLLAEPAEIHARDNDCRAALLDDDGGSGIGAAWRFLNGLLTGEGPGDAITTALSSCKNAFVDAAEGALVSLKLLDPRNWDDIANDGVAFAQILYEAAEEERLIAMLEELAITAGSDLLGLHLLQDDQGAWQLQGNMVEWASYLGCRTLIDFLTGVGVQKLRDFVATGRAWLTRRDSGLEDGRSDFDFDGTSCPVGLLLSTNSFPAGTMVRMADDSYQSIDQIRAGDWVISHNLDTSVWEPKEVVSQWSQRERGPPVTLTLSDGAAITATAEHRFYTTNRGWVPLAELEPHDQLLASHGTISVVSVEVGEAADWRVYDLSVGGNQNFTVLAGSHDLLVHNAGCLYRTRGEGASTTSSNPAEVKVAELREQFADYGLTYQYHHMVPQKFFRSRATADQSAVAQILIDAGFEKDGFENLIPMPYSPSQLDDAIGDGLVWAPNHVHRGGTQEYDNAIVERFRSEFPGLVYPADAIPADRFRVRDVLADVYNGTANTSAPTYGPHMQPGQVVKTAWTSGA